ncbi:MAG: putative peptidoglycan glycosyltransferase FtsW [Vampirovibrionales bacterium]
MPELRTELRKGHHDSGLELVQTPGRRAYEIDKPLLYITIALAVLGLWAVYSASARIAIDQYGNSFYFALRQFLFYAVGFGVMAGVSRVPFFFWKKAARISGFLLIALLIYTDLNGVVSYGAERWLSIAGMQFQPSELGKISVVFLLAHAFNAKRRLGGILFNLGLIGAILLLIYSQPSLSMTMLLGSVTFIVMIVAGVSPVLLFGGVVVLAPIIIYKVRQSEYQMRRIMAWINPNTDPQDAGYNILQSLYAVGSGGWFGSGLGMSSQKLYYLPFPYTDFIFAIWAEELGLIGCLVLIGLFVAFVIRGLMLARTSSTPFAQLLAVGIVVEIGLQAVFNMGVATGVFPVTGVTLPLISYGGTSVVVTLFLIGILLNISRYRLLQPEARYLKDALESDSRGAAGKPALQPSQGGYHPPANT